MDHEKTGDYVRSFSDYQTTMAENLSGIIDYDGLTRGKLCPLKERGPLEWADMRALMDAANGLTPLIACKPPLCDGPRCAWWDDPRQQCAALTLARSAVKIAGKK